MLLFNVLAAMPVMRIPRTAEAVSPIIGLIEFDIDMPSFIPFIILVVVRFERLDVINSTPSVKCYSVTIHGWGYEKSSGTMFSLGSIVFGVSATHFSRSSDSFRKHTHTVRCLFKAYAILSFVQLTRKIPV